MICDVSKWQGAIDWSKLAPVLDFVILRSSCGVNPDTRYHEYVNGCVRYGVPYHAYHYIKATDEAAARTEAKVMSEACAETSPLFYVIDAEYSGISASRARSICEAFEDGLRHYISPDIRVALYIGHHLYKLWALDYSRYAYLWIPRYGKNTGKPETKPDYPCDLWQYTSVGSLPGIGGNVDLNMIVSDKPMEFFTGKIVHKGSDNMAIDYNKYIMSTGTHYISNSGQDENKGYHGGKAGDQTGKEWQLKAWYNRPWSVVLRYPDIAVGLKIADLGCAAALNDKIGYDQWQRTTYWTQLQKVGYDPSKITVACEEDCTAGVTANVKAVGYLMGIKTLQNLPTDTYSGNMRSRFVAAGFKALTASKYLTSPNYLLPGDILLYEGHHAATNITYGKDVRPSETPSQPDTAPIEQPEGLHKGDYGSAVTALQILLLKWNPKCLPKYGADGDFGSETETALKSFQAENGLLVTGVYDEATRKALADIINSEKNPETGCDGDSCPIESPENDVPEGPAFVLAMADVNVRSAPGTDARIIGVLKKNYTAPYQEVKREWGGRDWYLVIFNGENGWVSSKYSEITVG